jgi:hypothetical protein
MFSRLEDLGVLLIVYVDITLFCFLFYLFIFYCFKMEGLATADLVHGNREMSLHFVAGQKFV